MQSIQRGITNNINIDGLAQIFGPFLGYYYLGLYGMLFHSIQL